MPKMNWNDFVEKHKTGHGLGVRSRLKLPLVNAQGKKPETVANVLQKTVKLSTTADWAVIPEKKPAKAGGGTFYHFIFAVPQDVMAAIKAISGGTAAKISDKSARPFVTYKSIGELMPIGYERLSAAIAKAAKPKKAE
ncbi:hypothetical protein EOB36_03720 [Mesorhizobium sp. M6A.T.Cr.TU.017.01.1.1]|uniref:hypothetical protein n=1 Tax=Mesorhizobium sp. M6A.T.Cr.TU.017.01.1.1 TaxID=2496774 RepID=UPI000FD23CDF|nr:hypothetical protein [Mesorhizobium sp. M6A.T.Cr.TU.017.01.1.1]RUV04148.1 hypothetical protein EOB36_03720 [Mesorhizobium sp. M6A.T.Cr.TU.017.01.1.1]